jgi:hypothetical protein
MELIEFNQTGTRHEDSAMMSISHNGIIRFNRAAFDKIGLKHGDRISFYQDKKQPMDWYFKVTDRGARLRHDTGGSSLATNFTNVAKEILKSLGISKIVRLRVATEPVEDGYYAIITRSGIENKK